MVDYLIEMIRIYMYVLYYVFVMFDFMCTFIIMSVIVKWHQFWCIVGDMRFS